MDSQKNIFSNPLLLRLAIAYIQVSRNKMDEKSLTKQLLEAGLDATTVDILLDDELTDENSILSKQPDPRPALALGEQTPSIALYFVLVVFAFVLILVAFMLKEPDWAGTSINLATEILGAVIILIVVDRRLRRRELQTILGYAETTSMRFLSLFSAGIRDTRLYAKAFQSELQRIRPKPYFERPDLESLFDRYPEGFLLSGQAGIGKTTLLQSIALKQVSRTIRQPKREKIPVLFPMRFWSDDTNVLAEQIWKTVRSYSELKRKRFYRWLEISRLIVIIDGLNEATKPDLALEALKMFKAKYPNISLIVSCRSHFLERDLTFLGLQTFEMPGLTKEDRAKFMRLLQEG
jgi:hypothetical protein